MATKLNLDAVAERMGITKRQLRKLMRLCDVAATAQERWHNEDKTGLDKAAEAACDAFTALATKYGFTTTWPGIYPALSKGGETFYMPDEE
jgi:hypothetical protein